MIKLYNTHAEIILYDSYREDNISIFRKGKFNHVPSEKVLAYET